MGKPTNEARIKRLEERADAVDAELGQIASTAADVKSIVKSILAWIKAESLRQTGRNRGN